jgi:ABC-type transport system involved in multi-copper enzyme maturation permease subunit
MMNLVVAESSRLWARRMTRFFPLGLVAVIVAGIVIAYFVIEGDDQNSPDFVNDVAGGIGAQEILGPVTAVLPLMAFVIGASYIGADSKTGMLEQLLTWEPRRLRFLFARVVSLFFGVAILAMALAVVLVALLFVLAALTGTTDGTSGEFWGNVAVIVLRSGLAAGLFSVFGMGVTLLVDNSVGSIVGFVIYWFIIENFLVAAFLPRVAPYLPIANADAFASGQDVERIRGSVFSDDFELIGVHDYRTAGVILVIWVAVALGGASVVFVRRDID